MKECLHCKKQFQPKKETAKFCGTSCRVMYNRKHGSKKSVSLVQIQVLYNSLLEVAERLSNISNANAGFKTEVNGTPIGLSHTTKQNLGIEKTFQQHMNDLSELDTEYEYKRKFDEIQAATNLTTKQKDLLITNMRQSKM
jgi:hypothetical protein